MVRIVVTLVGEEQAADDWARGAFWGAGSAFFPDLGRSYTAKLVKTC